MGTGGSKESLTMRYAIIHNGEQYDVSVTEILPGSQWHSGDLPGAAGVDEDRRRS
jgi:hypothetical protein